ncbi:hypothetical protein F4821DRAFT_228833 [Hypoxylon rubiginosum]|uniref:Uncharacterized protein n=1 Tax=Hypoxylon rubiginosum TaxID=110542 RepID=A0ACC0DDR9_9PEZI|nr:hypothetical protein F4821DRAFT_228833 [Hypoxylon rubiginosum]
MKFLAFLSTIFAAFVLLVAADQENYNVAREAAVTARGSEPDKRYRYAMLEYWHATNTAEQCVTGFSHVRLVVGKFSGSDFQAEAFDMISNGQGPSGGAFTGKTAPDREYNWLANRYFKDGQYKRVSTNNQYQWAGQVRTGITNDHIQSLGEQYCRDHGTYALVGNNCYNYATWLRDQILA